MITPPCPTVVNSMLLVHQISHIHPGFVVRGRCRCRVCRHCLEIMVIRSSALFELHRLQYVNIVNAHAFTASRSVKRESCYLVVHLRLSFRFLNNDDSNICACATCQLSEKHLNKYKVTFCWRLLDSRCDRFGAQIEDGF
jgi:hypothetical protein